jgi:hypothetical protein
MKQVVSISLGSSSRNKKAEFKLGNETILLERIGCDGDAQKAKALFTEMDGQVDAFGVGGIELYVRVAHKNYAFRQGLNLVENVKRTPYTDGRGVKWVMERNIFQLAAPELDHPLTPRRAMMPFAVDRYAMAKSLASADFELICCDLIFGLSIPMPLKGLTQLRRAAYILAPILRLAPITLLYPVGENQDEIVPKYDKWFNFGPVIAGDFHFIRRHMPDNLGGKIIITNTTTEQDIELLRTRGVAYVVTSSPRLEGRSFGTNVLEAALIAYAGKGRPLTDTELATLIEELGLKPTVQALKT